jgi:chitinase
MNMKIKHLILLVLFPALLACTVPENTVVPPPPPSDGGNSGTDPGTDPGTNPAAPDGGYIIVGYDYGSGNDVLPDPAYLTHVNFAFGKIGNDFETLEIKKADRLQKVVALKKTNPTLKVLLSIGGWGAGNFSEMAASDEHRKKFCENCLAAVNKYGLDGIDLDWEFPTSSSAGISASANDKNNYTKLIKDLREVLGNDKLLTMASADDASSKYYKFADFIDYMDFVNIMAYNMGAPPETHHSALYSSSRTKLSCEESVAKHNAVGIPLEKLVLGVPFYGRDANHDETYYKDILTGMYSSGAYIQRWDEQALVPFLTDASGTMVLSYDNAQSLGHKAEFIKKKGLKGAMYWAIKGDDPDWTLSKALAGPLLGWNSDASQAFLATNAYVEKYMSEVDYTDVIKQYPEGKDGESLSLVTNYPGGGPSVNNEEIPPTYTIKWTAASSAQKLVVSEGDWSREYSLSAGVSSQDITNLVPNTTYQWIVTTTGDAIVASGSFPTRGHLRQVYYEPDVRNGRDLGGYKGLDGKTVVYHKLFRGGAIHKSRTSDKGKQEMLAEGIRAEVDLRESSDVPSSSPLGSSVDFLAPGFDSGYNTMIRDNKPKVKDTFCWVVQKLREGKPVYFHCAAGRDRTATLAILLEGALGVSESDMAKDYELTYFTPADWGMSDDGTTYKHTWDNYSYGSVHKTIFSLTDSGTYQERIVKYLLQIGVPQQDIDDLRDIMLK